MSSATSSRTRSAATLALAACALSLASLLALHVTDPQLDPAWRMVSEYADGHAPWLLRLFFAAWALSSWALVRAVWPVTTRRAGRLGALLVALAGVGEGLAAFFDVHHPLHGAAFAIGVPGIALGAPLVGHALARRLSRPALAWTAHLPWLSVLAMVVSFAVLMQSAKAVGVTLTPGKPWGTLPPGVVAVMGWANRAFVVCALGWVAAAAQCLRGRVE